MSENIQSEIVSILLDVSGFGTGDITSETNFSKDLEIDSIKAIEIRVANRKKFEVSVRDEDVPNITTVEQPEK